MAGACPVSLAVAVSQAGGMGACGALLMRADDIGDWVSRVRTSSNGAFQLNTWIPDPSPVRDEQQEAAWCEFLNRWGPPVDAAQISIDVPDFQAQCTAMLDAAPRAISSIMGLYPAAFVKRMKAAGIHWFATATTVAEALEAEQAGADVIVAQGMEAGGHRGAFNAQDAASNLVGLFSLLPAVCDAVKVPVVATGGVGDSRAVAAALTLGASAVQIGTALLRSPEAQTPPVWADAIGQARPENTVATRAFSGRLGRSLRTGFTQAADSAEAPEPACYPVQRGLTAGMRQSGFETGDLDKMQAWAGQSSAFARAMPAAQIVEELWQEARQLLPR